MRRIVKFLSMFVVATGALVLFTTIVLAVLIGGYAVADLVRPVDWPDLLTDDGLLQFLVVVVYIASIAGAVVGIAYAISND
ncbi:hypothetical protein LCGC14_1894920 [marine sediment metagenome]|uniref:Uncharacterized protein n=1 Tax=marine sediment metagenome TaxID=412755 RepID=A0A0F9FYM3_9ZZZZ